VLAAACAGAVAGRPLSGPVNAQRELAALRAALAAERRSAAPAPPAPPAVAAAAAATAAAAAAAEAEPAPLPAAAASEPAAAIAVGDETWRFYRLQRMLADVVCLAARQDAAAQAVAAAAAAAAATAASGDATPPAAAEAAAELAPLPDAAQPPLPARAACWQPSLTFIDAVTATRAWALPPSLCVSEAARPRAAAPPTAADDGEGGGAPPPHAAAAAASAGLLEDAHAPMICAGLTRGAIRQAEEAPPFESALL